MEKFDFSHVVWSYFWITFALQQRLNGARVLLFFFMRYAYVS